LGLSPVVTFTGALPARQAFAKGWLMVIPSRAESFPYIVLETVAAAKPLLATRVGGIAEVMPEHRLVATE
jgi:glycosyltransferase involved in cell wall biosynthesis